MTDRRRIAAAAAAVAALVLAGCLGAAGDAAGDGEGGDGENRYESAVVTAIGAVDLDRGVAVEATLRAGLYCPDTERRRFQVRAAFVGDDTVLGWSSNETVVPREGNATVWLPVPPHVDVGAMRLVRIQAYRNGTRSTPACPEIADPGDTPTTATRFAANVTASGFGPVQRAGPPDTTVRS